MIDNAHFDMDYFHSGGQILMLFLSFKGAHDKVRKEHSRINCNS